MHSSYPIATTEHQKVSNRSVRITRATLSKTAPGPDILATFGTDVHDMDLNCNWLRTRRSEVRILPGAPLTEIGVSYWYYSLIRHRRLSRVGVGKNLHSSSQLPYSYHLVVESEACTAELGFPHTTHTEVCVLDFSGGLDLKMVFCYPPLGRRRLPC